jgi:hypothetical protein
MLVGSIGTRSFLAHLRVLAESLAEHLPGPRLQVLALDAEPGELDGEPFDVLLPGDLDISPDEWAVLLGIYDAMSLSCAIKPLLLRRLLRDDESALYLDADMRAGADLQGLAAELAETPVLLSRHLWRSGNSFFEHPLLLAGSYNAGLVGVRRDGAAFVDWWWQRARRHAVLSYPEGLYFEQHFLDLAPTLFPTAVVADPGINVLTHGLELRDLAGDAERGWTVDGAPVRLFHAGGGFDPAHPFGLTAGTARPTLRPSRLPPLAALYASYRDDLLAAGWEQARGLAYRFDTTPDGLRLDRTMRRAYRDHVLRAEARDEPLPPSPFAPDGGAGFEAWLREPADRRREAVVVPRYLVELRYEEPLLAQRVPDLLTNGRTFLRHVEVHRDDVPERLRGPAGEPAAGALEGPFELVPGVTLVGPRGQEGIAAQRAGPPRGRARRRRGPARARRVDRRPRRARADGGRGGRGRRPRREPAGRRGTGPPRLRLRPRRDAALLALPRRSLGLGAVGPRDGRGAAVRGRDLGSIAGAGRGPRRLDRQARRVDPASRRAAAARPRADLGLPEGPLAGTAIDLAAPDAAPRAQAAAALAAARGAGAGALLVLLGARAQILEAERVLAEAGPGVVVREAAGTAEAARLLAGCDAQLVLGPGIPLHPLVADVAAAGVPTVAVRGTDADEALAAVLASEAGPGAARPQDAAEALRGLLADPSAAVAAGARAAEHLLAERSAAAVGRRIADRLAELTALDVIPVGPRGERPPPAEPAPGAQRAAS